MQKLEKFRHLFSFLFVSRVYSFQFFFLFKLQQQYNTNKKIKQYNKRTFTNALFLLILVFSLIIWEEKTYKKGEVCKGEIKLYGLYRFLSFWLICTFWIYSAMYFVIDCQGFSFFLNCLKVRAQELTMRDDEKNKKI